MENKLKVVVADDMEILALNMQELIASNSKVEKVWTAFDGEDEIIKIMRVEPDIVFTDMQMPKRTGLDVIKAIKDYPTVRKKPQFILVTAESDKMLHIKARELGFFIEHKPISPEKINQYINEFEPVKVDEKKEERKRQKAFRIMKRELRKERLRNMFFKNK